MIDVPTVVENRAKALGAQAWLDGLHDLVDDLSQEWGFTIVGYYDGGTEAVVARVELPSGQGAVLKLLIPRHGHMQDREITVLALANGNGCPELYRHDADRNAILMEQLGPSLFDLKLPIEQRHSILCDTAAKLWRPVEDVELPTGAEKANWLIDYVSSTWDELDRPCSEQAVDHALACATRRANAHDDERSLLVHGDVHEWNVLQAADGYKLVDPDGLLAEPEYDLGIIMREDPLELMVDGAARQRSHWLAERSGLDETAIWEWGVIERVSTGLMAAAIDLQPIGRQMLAAADRIAAKDS